MLVLTRKQQQTLLIETPSGPIEVTIVDINGGKVKVGITADRSFQVVRKELLEQQQKK